MAPLPISQSSVLLPIGANQRPGLSQLVNFLKHGPAPSQLSQLQQKKRRLAKQWPRMPTIVEAEEEKECASLTSFVVVVSPPLQPPLLPSGLPENLTDPMALASSGQCADAFAARLKCACENDRCVLLSWLGGVFPSLALSEVGSHVVQIACKVASGAQRMVLISKLQGYIVDLCMSPHGCEVLTTLVESMPVSAIGFVPHELTGSGGQIARNRFGFRVLEAVTMHCSVPQMAALSQELVLEAAALSRHAYGHRVIQHLLEYGTQACQSCIIQNLMPEMPLLAMNRTASRVVQKALDHVGVKERYLIAMALLQSASPAVVDVACSRAGSSVIVEFANQEVCVSEFRVLLAKQGPRLAQSKFGRRVIDHFGILQTAARFVQSMQR